MKPKLIFLSGLQGSGKGQPINTIIQTPSGNRKIGSLFSGDFVFGLDGKPHKIINIFNRGTLKTYEVSFTDGASLVVDADHLWTFEGRLTRFKNKPNHRIKYTYSTKQLIDNPLLVNSNIRGICRKHIPIVNPIEYNDDSFDIDPYILGLYLADGCTVNSNIRITKKEIDIISYIYTLDDGPQVYHKYGTNTAYHSYKGSVAIKFINYLKLRKLIDKKSHDKFIPEEWFTKNIYIRTRLLQGLMDGDGGISRKLSSISKIAKYSTTSIELATNVQRLVCSLGGQSKIVIRHKKNYLWYEVRIYTDFNPFLKSIWKNIWVRPIANRSYRFLKSIKYFRREKVVCITVDSPDNLYVADTQFSLLTHNSTYAIDLLKNNPGQYVRVNKDDLRATFHAGRWSKSNEQFINKLEEHIIREALVNKLNVVWDNVHLAPKHLERANKLVKDTGAVLEKKFFDTPLAECLRRDALRPNPVGSRVIMDTYNRYLKTTPTIPVYDESLPNAFIFDIDGSLALMSGRNAFEWSKVGTDIPNIHLIKVLQSLFASGYTIIIVSGRDSVCREGTEFWLDSNDISYHHLFMRPQGNNEKDTIIKKRIYDEYLKDKFNIYGVFDDRPCVVKMWKELGFFVFDCGDGIDF